MDYIFDKKNYSKNWFLLGKELVRVLLLDNLLIKEILFIIREYCIDVKDVFTDDKRKNPDKIKRFAWNFEDNRYITSYEFSSMMLAIPNRRHCGHAYFPSKNFRQNRTDLKCAKHSYYCRFNKKYTIILQQTQHAQDRYNAVLIFSICKTCFREDFGFNPVTKNNYYLDKDIPMMDTWHVCKSSNVQVYITEQDTKTLICKCK
jgi:hypothetical protein